MQRFAFLGSMNIALNLVLSHTHFFLYLLSINTQKKSHGTTFQDCSHIVIKDILFRSVFRNLQFLVLFYSIVKDQT